MFGQVSGEERKVVNYLIQSTELEGLVSLEDISRHTGKVERSFAWHGNCLTFRMYCRHEAAWQPRVQRLECLLVTI